MESKFLKRASTPKAVSGDTVKLDLQAPFLLSRQVWIYTQVKQPISPGAEPQPLLTYSWTRARIVVSSSSHVRITMGDKKKHQSLNKDLIFDGRWSVNIDVVWHYVWVGVGAGKRSSPDFSSSLAVRLRWLMVLEVKMFHGCVFVKLEHFKEKWLHLFILIEMSKAEELQDM